MATESYGSRAADGRRKKLMVSSSSISSTLGDDEDLLVEILIRLPCHRFAFRCKPVSKRWNSLISTPYFSRRFASHHRALSVSLAADEPEPPVLTLSQVRESILSFLPLPDETQSKFSVLDWINDLLLLGFWPGSKTDPELLGTYLICNFLTKQWAALPLAPKMSVRPASRGRWIVKLVCEPVSSGEGQEFPCGFRVVRMYNPERSTSSRVDLYMFRSRSGRWTRSVLRLDRDLRCSNSHRHRVASGNGGKLYWLNSQGRVVKWDPLCPDSVPILTDGSELGDYRNGNFYGPWISEGALHVIFSGWNSDGVSVWRLGEEDGGGWRKQDEVRSLGNFRMRDLNLKRLDLKFLIGIGLHPKKPEIVFLSLYTSCSKIFSLNLRKKELEVLNDQGAVWACQDEQIYQPRIDLWPNLISSYEKLQTVYNGSYNCWLSQVMDRDS